MQKARKKKQKKKGNLAAKACILAFGGLAAVGGTVYSSSQVGAKEATVSAQEAEIRAKKNELETKKASASATKVKVKKSVTGLDDEVVKADRETAEAFFKPAFSWSSGEDYDNARALYSRALGEDSSFVTLFMPENIKVDQYNYVDQTNANSTFTGMKMYPIGIDGDGYTYMGFVDFSSRSAGLDGESGGTAAIMFTVDGDKVFDVEAWSVAP